MLIATLYFGSDRDGRHARMLCTWFEAFRAARVIAPVVVISDMVAPHVVDCAQLRLPVDHADGPAPEHPFDVKGLLLCEALRRLGPFLYLDLDALPVRDPLPFLRKIPERVALGMPVDIGAVRRPLLETKGGGSSFEMVLKSCAGVMYFGDARPGMREALAIGYAAAFAELLSAHRRGLLDEKRSLLEQWAWSVVLSRLAPGQAFTLPDALNWPAGVRPSNESTIVEHWYGPQKEWRFWGAGADAQRGRMVAAEDL